MGAELTVVLDAALRVWDADTELMLRFQAGEADCFDALVGRYRKPLLGFVFRLLRDAAASEEIVQEAFLRVYLHRSRYRPQARFSTWVYRIAHHLALNYIRDHRRDRWTASLDQRPIAGEAAARAAAGEWRELARELADARPTAEQAMIAVAADEARQARVRAAIAALPQRQRSAVILHKYQGLDYEAIAAVLRSSPSATKSLLFRAYESLRQQLHDLLP